MFYDASELMSENGYGVVYTGTSRGTELRHDLRLLEREELIRTFYLHTTNDCETL